MKTIRFGIIGGGLMGREFASAAARWMHLTDIQAKPEIVALCDKNPAIYPWYQQNFPTLKQVTDDYKALLANKDVDGVYIAVPHNLHAEASILALQAGKAVMLEKPMAPTVADCDAIVEAVAQTGVPFMMAHPYRYMRAYQEALRLIREGAIGRPVSATAAMVKDWTFAQREQWHLAPGGGMWLTRACSTVP